MARGGGEMEGQCSCQPDRQAHLFQAGQPFSPASLQIPSPQAGPWHGDQGGVGRWKRVRGTNSVIRPKY